MGRMCLFPLPAFNIFYLWFPAVDYDTRGVVFFVFALLGVFDLWKVCQSLLLKIFFLALISFLSYFDPSLMYEFPVWY